MAIDTSASKTCSACGHGNPTSANFCMACGASLVNGGPSGSTRRVVVTGVGAVTPVGNSGPDSWRRILAGESGIKQDENLNAEAYSCTIRGDVDDETIPNTFLDPKTARNTSPYSRWVVESAGQALIDAGLLDDNLHPSLDLSSGGAVVGTCVGGAYDDLLPGYEIFLNRGPNKLSPHLHVRFPNNMAAYTMQWRFGMVGPSNTVSTACATGTQAIGEAFHTIKHGRAPIMMAGATESTSHPMGVAGFAAMRALVTDSNDRPSEALRPFDATRAGFALGEGAAVLILEDLEFAQARGAKVYAEILGFASTNDGYHAIAPRPEGDGAARAILGALADAGVTVDQVGHVQAHAASTPAGDLAEANAIKIVFGERARSIPVTSIKGAIGHCMGGAGAIETVMAIYSLADQLIPQTLNYKNPDPQIDLDIVAGEPRPAVFNIMTKHGFGLGGQNACLVLGLAPEGFEQRTSGVNGY
jgi:3-oxoacyl-[acyl-carrier-protein] synthase II